MSLSVVSGGCAAGSAKLREDGPDEEAGGRPGGSQRADEEAQSPHRSGLLELHHSRGVMTVAQLFSK